MLEAMLPPAQWERLGTVAPTELLEARLLLHWAAQVVAAAGQTLAPAAPDDSHASLHWDDSVRGLAGEAVGPGGERAVLRLEDLSLLVLSADGRIAATRDLAGSTLADALGWLRDALVATTPLKRPEHDLPEHPVASGGTFVAKRAAFEELAAWFANADRVLRSAASLLPSASPVRCWPHHFDIATLVKLDPADGDPEQARSVGLGLSPGDDSYPEPYWYVLPWPAPDLTEVPAPAGGGQWHREGWQGAVLTGSALVGATDQAAQVVQFLDSASATSLALLSR